MCEILPSSKVESSSRKNDSPDNYLEVGYNIWGIIRIT